METNIVCSDTYIDAFSRLDKKVQKKSLETIRLMQRSLRSDSLKIEKLNTKLNFKSARVTQDFRVIFTQSGNTVLLVYIAHHDDAYLWAGNRLQGFDAASAKPVCEYFEQAKAEDFNFLNDTAIPLADSKKSNESSKAPKTSEPIVKKPLERISPNHTSPTSKRSLSTSMKKLLFTLFFFLLGAVTGIIITVMLFLFF